MFLVRKIIIVIFKYLQQSYKMINIKRTEVHRTEDNDSFLFIKSAVHMHVLGCSVQFENVPTICH